MSGQPVADLEVVQRTLRVRDQKQAARLAAAASAARPAPLAEDTRVPLFVEAAPPPAALPTTPLPPTTLEAAPATILSFTLDKKAPATGINAEAVAPTKKTKVNVPLPAIPAEVVSAQVRAKENLAAPASVPPVPAAAPESVSPDVTERLLALVVEKTGYPKDMLDLELDLEADLGVDTVKQAELFAAIREIYSIPRDQNLKLRDFPTLAHVVRFVYDRRPDLNPETPKAARPESKATIEVPAAAAVPESDASAPAAMPGSSGGEEDVKERLLALVVEKTGYPKDMLDLELDLEADLGVDTVKQAELFAAIREIYSIPRDQNLKLRDFPTLAHVIQFVYDRRPDLRAEAPKAPAKNQVTVEAQAASSGPDTTIATTAVLKSGDEDVKERLLALVVEKTGYPKDMLDLELDWKRTWGWTP